MATKTDATALGTSTVDDDVAGLSFEQAREELNQVVARLEAGGEPLESALALWERGEALAAHCQVWLDGARARFESVTAETDTAPTEAIFNGAVPF